MKSKTTLHRMFILLITLMSAISANAAEAYACYTPSNATLTFYYDNLRSTRSNTYNLNTGVRYPGWYNNGTNADVTEVVFDPSFAGARPTTTLAWFCNMTKVQTIKGFYNLNTSNVTDMSFMFQYCSKLTSLELTNFNTASVTKMTAMFSGCTSLLTIYVGDGWTTSAVTSSSSMFYNCTSLVGGKGTTYNANYIDKTYAHIDGGTSNRGYLTERSIEAYACYTSTNTTLTFYYDNQRGLHEDQENNTYDLNTGNNSPGWHVSSVFHNVTKVVFDSSFAGARPTTTYDWFYYMYKLQSITGMKYLNTSEVTDMGNMFNQCSSLTSLDLSNFNTAKVTRMLYMFYKCSSLTSLDLSSFNTSKVISIQRMFKDCSSLQTIYVGDGWNMEAVSYDNEMFTGCTSLVGGKGTTYNENYNDGKRAHIDGDGGPGYFTARTTGIATDLHQVTSDKQQVQSDEWYTIDGRKLNGMPAKKGVYIQNGKKTVVKEEPTPSPSQEEGN